MEITVSQLRDRIQRELEIARFKVAKLEAQLLSLEELLRDINKFEPTQQPLFPPTQSKRTVGGVLRERMENTIGEWQVPQIVNAVGPELALEFPREDYKSLSKKASHIAHRLASMNIITAVKKGAGKTPNIYVSHKK